MTEASFENTVPTYKLDQLQPLLPMQLFRITTLLHSYNFMLQWLLVLLNQPWV